MKNIWLLLSFSVFGFAQQVDYVDFKHANVDISIDPEDKQVSGSVIYEFEVIKDIDSIYIDAQKMLFSFVSIDDRKTSSKTTDSHLIVYREFKKGDTHKLELRYAAHPKKAMYFIGWDDDGRKQVWTQGQGKYTSNWLPSFDDMNEKVEFDLTINFEPGYRVIANGKLIERKDDGAGKTSWKYDMQKPMSSYLLAVAIGDYAVQNETTKNGTPLEFYYYKDNYHLFSSTYDYSVKMFDYLEDEIGVPYPWQNYKQVPVKDFLYAGMENTTATIFSDAFVVDKIGFNDKNYININAHELAHQWFGDLVTAKHGTHHWLQEGFATYYALLAEQDIFGNDHYYHELYKNAQLIELQSKTHDTIPLMNPNASSLTFYQKGALTLHILREKVGDKAFKNSVRKYLKKYQFRNVETNDFISIVEKESGMDLSTFVDKWLIQYEFPTVDVRSSLSKNTSVKHLYEFKEGKSPLSISKKGKLPKGLHHSVLKEIVIAAANTFDNSDSKSILRDAFQHEHYKVRQAVVMAFNEVPFELKKFYEDLLFDNSYVTREAALYSLWYSFPLERKDYLDKTKDAYQDSPEISRMLWISLLFYTPGYEQDTIMDCYQELVSYTDPEVSFEVRERAFRYLSEIKGFNEIAIKNLVNASKHHNWRFKKYAIGLLKELKKEPYLVELIEKYEN